MKQSGHKRKAIILLSSIFAIGLIGFLFAAYELSPSSAGFVESCPSDELRIWWHHPDDGWTTAVALNMQSRLPSGESWVGGTNSNVSPFLRKEGDPPPRITDKHFANILSLLAQLPPGESYLMSRLSYDGEIHIAFFQNGVLIIRHYPRENPPVQVTDLIQECMTGDSDKK